MFVADSGLRAERLRKGMGEPDSDVRETSRLDFHPESPRETGMSPQSNACS